MNFWKMFALVRRLPIDGLLDFPDDIRDKEDVRKWVRAVLETGGILAYLTSTKIDDKIVESFTAVIEDDVVWANIHGLLVKFVVEDPGVPVAYEAMEAGEKTGIAPELIMLIVQALHLVWKIYQWSRK